mgnify:CR=1 FL=1
MPYEAFVFDHSFKAAADLTTKQFYLVKLTAADTVGLTAAVTDATIGVLQNKPNTAQAAQVRILGISKVVSDGSSTAIAVGDKLATNTSGKVVKNTTSGRPIVGTALNASTTDGGIISVLLTPNTHYATPA